ncbi:MAG: hypothetical protein FWG40_03890 [Peptococcaceae bacterium]|nr:hypothetical protein [Peptococcaceae bacterium]
MYENEHLLSKEALKIDVLIIKKEREVRIEKNIGRIFRNHNIFEYKSETDSLTVSDYDKVLAYGLLYSVFEGVPKSDITLTFAFTKHPRELIKSLEGERKLTVDDKGGGIYYIEGEIFPVQLLERNRLSKEDNLFLKNLGSKLSFDDVMSILSAHREQRILEMNNVYLDRVRQANKLIFMEVMNMSTATEYFFEVADKKGWLEEKRREGREEGELRVLVHLIHRKMLKNKTREQIIEELELNDAEVKILDRFDEYANLLEKI